MEFPKLGQHCSESTCKQLDFLPMKCDACHKIFCNDHIQYTTHSCPESYKKDKQVPVCPLCNTPIPLMTGELADVKVGHHIDSLCQSNPAKERRKIYTNKCSYKTCKQKELIPVKCDRCRLNYCLKHRHESDHACQGFQGTGRAISQHGAAAISRTQAGPSKPQPTHTPTPCDTSTNRHRVAQSHMTDDEAMSRAIALSLAEGRADGQPTREMTQQEREDAMLAAALAASEEEARPSRTTSRQVKSSCSIA